MILKNSDNLLEIENLQGRLIIDRDLENGLTIYLHNPLIALSMECVLEKEELVVLTSNWHYARIRNCHQTSNIGNKKVLETIVAANSEIEPYHFNLTFISEDTTYSYELSSEEWNEIMTFCSMAIEI